MRVPTSSSSSSAPGTNKQRRSYLPTFRSPIGEKSSTAPPWPRPSPIGLSTTRKSSLRSEEHTSELPSRLHLVCRLLLEKKKKNNIKKLYTCKDIRVRKLDCDVTNI